MLFRSIVATKVYISDNGYAKVHIALARGKKEFDVGVLDTLVERSQLFHYSKTVLYLFAKKGFTQGCVEKANEMGNVVMVTFEDIMKSFRE